MAFFDFEAKLEKKEYDTKVVTIKSYENDEPVDFKIQALGGLKFTKMTYDTDSAFERVVTLLLNGTLKEETKTDSEGREYTKFVPAFKNKEAVLNFIEEYPPIADRLAGEISIFTQESFRSYQESKKNTRVNTQETDSTQSEDNTAEDTV